MKLSQSQTIVESNINFNMDLSNGRDAQYIVPMLIGGSGLGKTTMVKEATANVSEKRGVPMECRIVSLAQYDPTEIAGWTIPSEDRSHMVRMRPDWMPTDGYGVIFFDELPQAIVACMNIAAQAVNERRVGPHHLPDGWVVVCAGNRMSDRAGTNQMPSHLKDRMMFLEIEADLDDTLAYFNSVGVDFRVNSFLRFRPEYLHKFDRDANACPSPRSWERVSSILSWGLDPVCQLEAIAGQVGRAAAADFNGFLKIHETCPDIDALISDPMGSDIAEDPAVAYAITANLAFRMTDKNAHNIIKYLMRLPQKEFAVFCVKDALSRNKDLKKVKAVRDWIMTEGRHMIL